MIIYDMDELKTEFETGEDLKKSIKRFSETLEVDKSNARRLIYDRSIKNGSNMQK